MPTRRTPAPVRAATRPAPSLGQRRIALLVVFALLGLALSSWLARLPSIRDVLGLTPSTLSLALLAGAVGAFAATAAAGYLAARFGGRTLLVASAATGTAALAALGASTVVGGLVMLCLGAVLFSVGFSLSNVVVNVESAALERRMDRSVLPQFHASFSVGAVLGALVAAGAAGAVVPVVVQFSVVGVVTGAGLLALLRYVAVDTVVTPSAGSAPEGPQRGALRTALRAWRERRTLLLGLIVFAAALSEGSANQWVALGVVDGFAAAEAVGALFYGLFVAAMTLLRMVGTRLVDHFGRVAVLRASSVVALVGLVTFCLAPSVPLAGVGVVAWGFGAALAYPLVVAAAADEPTLAGTRVAAVTSFASIARLVAPPVLGLAADQVGIRPALLLVAVGLVASVVLARQVAPLVPAEPGSAEPVADEPVAGDSAPPGPASSADHGSQLPEKSRA